MMHGDCDWEEIRDFNEEEYWDYEDENRKAFLEIQAERECD